MLEWLWLVGGIVVLVVGAEALVRGASRLALAAGMSRLFVGLVIVSIATSAPEFATSVQAALGGGSDLALGNVIGSNTFNILLILGASALIGPIAVTRRLVRLDLPLMAGLGVLAGVLCLDRRLALLDGLVLLAAGAAYIALQFRLGRASAEPDAPAVDVPELPASKNRARSISEASLLTAAGFILLVLGARATVHGAQDVARSLGASELVVGLTVVAAGTSLPEATTSILAAFRGERDIAIGNVVGSNAVNVTLILGAAASVAPAGLDVAPGALTFDLPLMLAASIIVVPLAWTAHRLSRWEGGLFVAFYAANVAHLVLTASQHAVLAEFRFALAWFVLPLLGLGLAASILDEIRRPTKPARE